MHALHDYLCERLNEHLDRRLVVVLYDPRREFEPFFDREIQTAAGENDSVQRVFLRDRLAFLARYEGSMLALRTAIEPLVWGDRPERLVVYLPGLKRDPKGSVLMEVERGGYEYNVSLGQLARNALLRCQFTDGQIDDLLRPASVGWDDVVAFIRQGSGSVLRSLFDGLQAEGLLARWLADDGQDGAISDRGAAGELFQLVDARLGLALPADAALADARDRLARYVLVNEFRADLSCAAPASVGRVPETPNKDALERVRSVARALRRDEWDRYAALADKVEADLALANAGLDAACLGSVDTFRFEERRLLAHAAGLIERKRYSDALAVVKERGENAWLVRDTGRGFQWEACRHMASLGLAIEAARTSVSRMSGGAADWVSAYTDPASGWYRADLAQRRLESFVARMEEDAEADGALAAVRREHDDLVAAMATGFAGAYRAAAWTVAGALHQTRVYPTAVQRCGGGKVAWFWVDAMRFEMGVDLARQLQGAEDVTVRPAVAALPSITPIGMAALLPGASASFSVAEAGGKLAAVVEGVAMPGVAERVKLLKAKVPDAVVLTIEELSRPRKGAIEKAIGNASLVVVRSQEVDAVGETLGDSVARQVMDGIVNNLARAVRRLADAGIEHFVLTADHGHLFGVRREDDMRTDAPGGDTVALHRRCWIGRGGTTPPGTVRVQGAELGYVTDLEFVFPTGLGVFRAGGNASYHHGGFSLQELIVPVVSLRLPVRGGKPATTRRVTLGGVPDRVTNRTFGIRVAVAADLLDPGPVALRLLLVAGEEVVGQAGMAVGGAFDRATGDVAVAPGGEASIGMMLGRDDVEKVRILVLDPRTDAVLDRSDEIPVKLGIG